MLCVVSDGYTTLHNYTHSIKTASHSGAAIAQWKSHATHYELISMAPPLCFQMSDSKAVCNVTPFQTGPNAKASYARLTLPCLMTVFQVDRLGLYAAAGTAKGHLYLWDVGSGRMLASFDAHYKAITVIRFSQDGAGLFVACDNGSLDVWSVADIIQAASNSTPKPMASLNQHKRAISDLHVGIGQFPRLRLYSASLDSSVKIWDIATGTVMTSISFPAPINRIALDPLERCIMAVDDKGVWQHDLITLVSNISGPYTSYTGALSTNQIHQDTGKPLHALQVPETTAICFDVTGTHVILGTKLGAIHIYNFPLKQLVSTINTHAGQVVHHLRVLPSLVDLSQEVNNPIGTFERMRGTSDAHFVMMQNIEEMPDSFDDLEDPVQDFDQDAQLLIQSLRRDLAKANQVNKSLYESAMTALQAES